MKLLTVIVPSYNMEQYLPRCLGSLVIAHELMEKLEVIVVNDGSKDRTSEIAHGFETKYPEIFKVIDKPNGHYGSCVNAALPKATGVFVKLLDADDYFDQPAFSDYCAALATLEENGNLDEIDAIVSDYLLVNDAGDVLGVKAYSYPTEEAFQIDDFQRELQFHILHQGVAFRLSLFDKIKYQQTEGCSYTDLEWVTYPMCEVRNFYYLKHSIYRYFIGREDQSINPEVLKRGVSIIVKLMRRMLGDYSTLTDAVRPGVKEYVNKVIATQLGLIYRSLLLEQNPYLQIEDVVSLDDLVRKVSPAMVSRTDLAVHSHFFDFHYVREFRRARTRQTFKFALFDFYVKLRERVASVLR